MYTIQNQINVAIVPSQISPVGSVAAILKMAAMSPYLRYLGASLCISFLGRRFQKKIIAEYIKPLRPPFWRPIFKMAAISKVIRAFQKLTDA